MALGSLALPSVPAFNAEGSAMVPISAGDNKIGEIKIKSPLDTFKETFTSSSFWDSPGVLILECVITQATLMCDILFSLV